MQLARMTIITILAAYSMLFVHSCATMKQVPPTMVSATYTEADALIAGAQQEIARLEAKADLTPNEVGQLAKAKAWVANIEARIVEGRAGAEGRELDAGDVITAAAPFLGPYGIPIGVAAGAISAWWRGRKKRKSYDTLTGMIRAYNRVKAKDGEFATALDKAGPALRAEMGTMVRNEVDVIRNGVAV